MTNSLAILTAFRDRLGHVKRIGAIIQAAFDVSADKRPCVRAAHVRRDDVVRAVAESLSTPFARVRLSARLRREVRETVEWMGGEAVSVGNRRLFRGVKPKAVKQWREAERMSKGLLRR